MLKIAGDASALRATELWRSPRLRAYNGPTLYRDGSLYAIAGPQLVCADAATGEVRWRERTGEGTLVGMGPHLLLLGHTTGDLRIVAASAEKYVEVSRRRVFNPEVVSVTGASVADGRVYMRNLREMVAFELSR